MIDPFDPVQQLIGIQEFTGNQYLLNSDRPTNWNADIQKFIIHHYLDHTSNHLQT